MEKGDSVGIWSPNRYEWFVTQFATARVGAILVTINPAYKAAELEYALNKAGVSLVLHAAGFRDADYTAMLAEVRDRCPVLRETICLEDGGRPARPGEQCTRGYSVMLGYWGDEEATGRAIDDDGCMHTGDLAVMDDDGYLSTVGRIKDMVIRGGENVYPREIEEFLIALPGVSEAYVIGVPSAKYGEEVMAWVKPAAGAMLSGEQLAKACRGKIASFKIPRYRKLVDSFPMTVTGKIQKFRSARLRSPTSASGRGLRFVPPEAATRRRTGRSPAAARAARGRPPLPPGPGRRRGMRRTIADRPRS